MDIVSKLPIELALHIMEFLSPQDLTRCLGVSTSWRRIVDNDVLWRSFCTELGLESISTQYIENDDTLRLCEWASLYINHMNHLLKNWKCANYSSYQLTKEDWYCCIACHADLIAVYYPRNSLVRIYKLQNKLILIQTLHVTVQNGLSIPDIFVADENTIIVCRGSVILIYKNVNVISKIKEDFELYKCIVETEEGLVVSNDFLVPWVERHRKLYVKIVTDKYLWIENDLLYIVDLNLNQCQVLNGTFRCLRYNGKEVFAVNDVLSIFSPEGNELCILDCENIEDLWVSPELVVVLIPVEEDQILEIWNLKSRSLINVMSVWKDPVLSISPDSKQIYILELYENRYTIRCVDLVHGTVPTWTYQSSFPLELYVHPEVHLIADKFLFARPSPLSNSNFLLLDCKSGHILYDSVMPPCLFPPCYIYCLSDRIFITADSNIIHVRSYI